LSPSVPLVLVGASKARALDVTGEAGAEALGAATEGAATQVVLEGMEHAEGSATAVSGVSAVSAVSTGVAAVRDLAGYLLWPTDDPAVCRMERA
jgi:hypothetical protein